MGGDYYDFIPTRPQLTGHRREQAPWALVMGDVMGKGVPAGLLMTLLRGMLRAEVLSGLPPDRILHDLNQLAQEDLAHSHRFVTLFYSDYDPRTRLLRLRQCGPQPAAGLAAPDRPGGAARHPRSADRSAERGRVRLRTSSVLEPGDVMLYYTDGVTEASGFSGERFDEQRLLRAFHAACRAGLDAQAILDQLFARLDRFVGSDRQPRGRCLDGGAEGAGRADAAQPAPGCALRRVAS